MTAPAPIVPIRAKCDKCNQFATVELPAHVAAAWKRDARLVAWLEAAAKLPNGVTIEHRAFDEEKHEWLPSHQVKNATEFEFYIKWGAKLGHFVEADALEYALNMALAKPAT